VSFYRGHGECIRGVSRLKVRLSRDHHEKAKALTLAGIAAV
jgi:hypothetical protein